MMEKPASASRRAVSCAAAYCGSSGAVRAEPKMATPRSTWARLSKPSMNSPMMRITRHVSVRVKSPGERASVGPWSSLASSVTGAMKSRRSSSTFRTAPELRLLVTCDGGVLPAARCPSSVRSRRNSCASCCAAASCCGLPRFPVAVRADRDLAGFFLVTFELPVVLAMRDTSRPLGNSASRTAGGTLCCPTGSMLCCYSGGLPPLAPP